MTEDARRFGERLAIARMLKLQLSQAGLADRLGLSLATLQAIERGTETAPPEVEAALAHVETRGDLPELAAAIAGAREEFQEACARTPASWASNAANTRTGAPASWGSDQDMATGPVCGALTRTGEPCIRTRLAANGRCANHGGLSTGPKTTEGRARARANLSLRWTKERSQ